MWPSCSPEAAEQVERLAPRVRVNPKAVVQGVPSVPAGACAAAAALDAAAAAAVWPHPDDTQSHAARAVTPLAPEVQDLHIAEKFRLAYLSRAARLRAVERARCAKQERRAQRHMGDALALEERWLDEL